MKRLILLWLPWLAVFGWALSQQASSRSPHIEVFSPQGLVKGVRQVRVRFSTPMVPFGEPRAADPFQVNCPVAGNGRWVDNRNWTYDFENDLAAGVRCEFTLPETTTDLSGATLTGTTTFAFSTGGPAIVHSVPYQGAREIDETQVFLLVLDGRPEEASVLSHAYFRAQGIVDPIGLRILSGKEREEILRSQYGEPSNWPENLLLVQARQTFPAASQVDLVWGAGILSTSGVATAEDQVLPFITRTEFIATFHCARESAQEGCIPITPLTLDFSASIPIEQAQKITLKGPDGRHWKPVKSRDDFVSGVSFAPPFPEEADFEVDLGGEIIDDAGRPLTNRERFPLQVRTAEYPPLARFAAEFGILEAKTDRLLPVTVRNLEPELSVDQHVTTAGSRLEGTRYRIPREGIDQILYWLRKMGQRRRDDREKSVFEISSLTAPQIEQTQKFSIPLPGQGRAFEVVGIPLPNPGLYVVELKSELLGKLLLNEPAPVFVPTVALVTNLSVHLKWGVESSLVWVTSLDKGEPVSGAAVQVWDCNSNLITAATTDKRGVALLPDLMPRDEAPFCSYRLYENGLLATATLADDLGFVHSSWNEGIEPWRFQLPGIYDSSLVSAHTVFDRMLLRAGETVHMKHVLRRHISAGFELPDPSSLPGEMVIRHSGSNQQYAYPVTWDAASGTAASEWQIPIEAKLGVYNVSLRSKAGEEDSPSWDSGSFRVEEYRVPLMRGLIRPPSQKLVAPADLTLYLGAEYLGGGAASHLPVTLRYQFQNDYPAPPAGYDGYSFSGQPTQTGVTQRGDWEEQRPRELHRLELTLDESGSARTTLANLPVVDHSLLLSAELEFIDPNGAVQTTASRIPLWPSAYRVGIENEEWIASGDLLEFKVMVTDLNGKPMSGVAADVELFERKTFSHRKRLVGGFYAYEHATETSSKGILCQGRTDFRGLLLCSAKSPVSGNVILEATTKDREGRRALANRSMWIVGEEEWWFSVEDHDRIDVIPERTHYEPGQKARLQIRMPFRKATALISLEREGIAEIFVRKLSGKDPVVEIPVKENYAPNVYVSVLAVRGRVSGVRPTATVDLGKPAYKLGIGEFKVGWNAHELKVKVTTDREVYKVREKARVAVEVRTADGKVPPAGGQIIVAAVDEGLLQLMPNFSWKLLDSMMGRRGYGVETSTAQMQVVGKRHFGLKALPQGGGGGKQNTRELFDTLLLWRADLTLDAQGRAAFDVPLNDSLTSFRIAVVAHAGAGLFGTGSADIRATQDLIVFSGIPPLVREGDHFRSRFSLRNTTDSAQQLTLDLRVSELSVQPATQQISLAGGESKTVEWDIQVPSGFDQLSYELRAEAEGQALDRIAVKQKVVPAIPVRVFQATLAQVDPTFETSVEAPRDALPGRGGLRLQLRSSLGSGLGSVRDYMSQYPYSCLEQKVSRWVVLKDADGWERIMKNLPAYLDQEGLAKYFPTSTDGSEVLTAYLLAVAHERAWVIPEESFSRLTSALEGFIEGRIQRNSALPTADLALRKMMAIEALSRYGAAHPALLTSLTIQPNLWPTSGVLDYYNVLLRVTEIRDRARKLAEVEQILRSRLNFQGTLMGFSTEATDSLWWLMISSDQNAARLILSLLESRRLSEELPRLVRGLLARQQQGHWDLTTANAWGVLAVEKFAQRFEKEAVSGLTTAGLLQTSGQVDWKAQAEGGDLEMAWPASASTLQVEHKGGGKPWLFLQSLAAIPLKEALSSGYRLQKKWVAVEQKVPGRWSAGDIARIELTIDAQTDMTWVVASDPIPAGSTILGTGLGGDSALAAQGERNSGRAWPVFEERSFEAFRSYYRYVPKGQWTFQYTIRLENPGTFELPPTRVEALYAPEVFGALPNQPVQVHP